MVAWCSKAVWSHPEVTCYRPWLTQDQSVTGNSCSDYTPLKARPLFPKEQGEGSPQGTSMPASYGGSEGLSYFPCDFHATVFGRRSGAEVRCLCWARAMSTSLRGDKVGMIAGEETCPGQTDFQCMSELESRYCFSAPNCVLSATTLSGPGLGSSAVLPLLVPAALPLLRGQACCLLSASEVGGALSALHPRSLL